MNSTEIKHLENIASQVRRDIIRMVNQAKSGHPGGSLGCAEILTALYFSIMDINPENFEMDGKNEDIFFLSNGHISPVFYSVLARRGYFESDDLSTFRKLGTRLQGHPTTHDNLPGVRIASGSLGQGLSAAAGCALAKKLNNDKHFVFVLTGDGELQEGQNWEALMFAAHHKIDNLIAIVDYNNKQIDGDVDDVISLGNLQNKIKSFGWLTIEADGNNMEDVLNSLNGAISLSGKNSPVCVIMKTIMGKGVDFMENKHQWHGVAPDDEQTKAALLQLRETLSDYKSKI